MSRNVGMQRALEVIVNEDTRGCAYRQEWDGEYVVSVDEHDQLCYYKDGLWFAFYIPTIEDVQAHDWRYEY